MWLLSRFRMHFVGYRTLQTLLLGPLIIYSNVLLDLYFYQTIANCHKYSHLPSTESKRKELHAILRQMLVT